MKKLARSFYLRPTLTVAKELLGKSLIRKIGRQLLIGRIVEVAKGGLDIRPAMDRMRESVFAVLGDLGGVLLFESMPAAITFANEYAAEHEH